MSVKVKKVFLDEEEEREKKKVIFAEKRFWIIVRLFEAWLPFGLKKGQISHIWPLLKIFARNQMVWPFGHFLAFFES